MNPTTKVVAAAAGLAASIGLAAPQALATGGLSITPSIVQGTASPGVLGTVSVSNSSSVTMHITASVRPWIQRLNGTITPDMRHTLSDISLSDESFSLAAGQKQTITLTLLHTPPGNALYGNVDVIGIPPTNKAPNGVTVNYRLIGSLRAVPSASDQKLSATARVHETGNRSRGTLSLAIENSGNTIDPITGTFQIRGAAGSVSGSVPSEAIVPGATVLAPLTRLHGQLRPGSYTATITLKQGGSTIVNAARSSFKIS